MLNLFLATLLFPLITIVLLARRTRTPALGWATTFFMALGVTGFSVLTAPWGFFGVSVRYGLMVLFVIALALSLRKGGGEEGRQESFFRSAMKVMIGLFFGAVALSAIGAHDAPGGTVDVAFPLRGGRYLVMHGGSTSAANQHVSHPSQRFALDIVAVNAFGRRAQEMMPAQLDRFYIWNRDVIAPCDGVIGAAVDGLPDNVPPHRDEKNLAGNHVAIECQGMTLYLAHLAQGSLQVRRGAQVKTGQVIGRVGNSGNTTEPHLHVHAEKSGTAINSQPGVPLTFDGQWLVRNDVVATE